MSIIKESNKEPVNKSREGEYILYRMPNNHLLLDFNNTAWTVGYPYYPKHMCTEVERGTCEGGPNIGKVFAELKKKYGDITGGHVDDK